MPIIRQHLVDIFCIHYTHCQVERKYTKDVFRGLLKQICLLWQNTPKWYVICKNKRIPAKTSCETYTLISAAFVSADSFKFQELDEPRMGRNCQSLLGTHTWNSESSKSIKCRINFHEEVHVWKLRVVETFGPTAGRRVVVGSAARCCCCCCCCCCR